jgi:hypothetical protein
MQTIRSADVATNEDHEYCGVPANLLASRQAYRCDWATTSTYAMIAAITSQFLAEVKAAVTAEKATIEQMIIVSLAMPECRKYNKMIGTSRNRHPTNVTRIRIIRCILLGLTNMKSRFSKSWIRSRWYSSPSWIAG